MKRDTDIIHHRSRETLNFIQRYHLACCPDVYETIYNFVSRSDSDLVRAIGRLIKDDGVTDENVLMLSQQKERERYMETLPDIVDSVIANIKQMTTGIQDSQETLADVSGKINKSDSALSESDLMYLSAQLIEASERYSQTLSEGRGNLSDSAAEISALKEQIRLKEAQLETDSLTGVGTRLYMERLFGELRDHAPEIESGVSVVIVDIDNFKTFNDDHGHRIGDQVLRLVADKLGSAREKVSYTVSRYGGEEFVLLFEDHPLNLVFEVVEGLRGTLESMKIIRKDTRQSLGAITASFGVAHLSAYEIQEAGAEINLDDMIHRADTAMYRAKRTGKNRVMIAPAINDEVTIDVDEVAV